MEKLFYAAAICENWFPQFFILKNHNNENLDNKKIAWANKQNDNPILTSIDSMSNFQFTLYMLRTYRCYVMTAWMLLTQSLYMQSNFYIMHIFLTLPISLFSKLHSNICEYVDRRCMAIRIIIMILCYAKYSRDKCCFYSGMRWEFYWSCAVKIPILEFIFNENMKLFFGNCSGLCWVKYFINFCSIKFREMKLEWPI